MTERRVARTDQLRAGDRIILVTPTGDLLRTIADVADAGHFDGSDEGLYCVTFTERPADGPGTHARASRAWLLAPMES